MTEPPKPTYRLIPSQYPPIGTFDTVATAADLAAVFDLVGWTNDRLVETRLTRLPENEWVYGRPNSSIVMAAFLHASPGRFNTDFLGAWYAGFALQTAIAEVAHHLRRETIARGEKMMARKFREYHATLAGSYVDLRDNPIPEVLDPQRHVAGQSYGEEMRQSGGTGVIYPSLRHAGGVNIVGFRPRNVLDVVQCAHFEVTVSAASKAIDVVRLKEA
jgi:RES domain-containing protein